MIDLDVMTKEERAVWSAIRYSDTPRVTQRQLAKKLNWIGADERDQYKSMETTTRRIRHIVRDLRVSRRCPILSDVKGYFIPKSEKEVREFLERMKATMKAQIKSQWETYKSIMATYPNIVDAEMEQLSLFNDPTYEEINKV